jgi:hypothetical protein
MTKQHLGHWQQNTSGNCPFPVEPYLPPKGKPAAIICDLDGTLAFAEGRDIYDNSKVWEDKLNEPLAVILSNLRWGSYGQSNFKIIFLSGRSENSRKVTEDWLIDKCDGYLGEEDFALFMRPAGDNRSDDIVKYELFNKYIRDNFDVMCWFEDKLSVCRLIKDLGIQGFSTNILGLEY